MTLISSTRGLIAIAAITACGFAAAAGVASAQPATPDTQAVPSADPPRRPTVR